MDELQLLVYGYVFFMGLIGLEFAWSRLRKDGGYRIGEATNNIGHGVVYQVWDTFTKGLILIPFVWVSEHIAWFTLPLDRWWAWLLAVVLFDLSSYWSHRHHHEVSFLWAIHGVHHAAEDFNFAAALRQPWFQHTFSWLYRLPLALVMSVEMYIGVVVFDFLYQFVQHTRYVPKLGPLEWVMNTPSHHRVHHARDTHYLDKNYGGILIVWDRLFGTFAEEQEEPQYGVTKPLNSVNPIWGNLFFYDRLARATSRASGANKWRLWWEGPEHTDRLAPGAPDVPRTPLENDQIGPLTQTYVLAWWPAILLGLVALIWFGPEWSLVQRTVVAAAIFATLGTTAGLLEGRSWARNAEVARALATPVALGLVFL